MRADAGSSSGGSSPFTENDTEDVIVPVKTGDGFVVGSDRFDQDPDDTTKEYRSFFNKVKGAFRAGRTSGNQWDDANVGDYSHAEGFNTEASGVVSHAEGFNTEASGSQSHAEGSTTRALGLRSHAEGYMSEATRDFAHAEGQNTTASGKSSHAEGSSTTASGNYGSHAEGQGTTASGDYGSHAEGRESLARRVSQHAHAAFSFSVAGDAQVSRLVFHIETTDAAATLLESGYNNAGAWDLETNRAHKVRIEAIARRTDVEGEVAGFTWEGVVARDSGDVAGSARIVGAPIEAGWSDTAAAGWAMNVAINEDDPANPYLEITGTGEDGKTIRWVAGMYVTEVG